MGFLNNRKKSKYANKTRKPIELCSYIMKNNKQIDEYYVRASKRFIYEGNTYVIKRKSVFTKIVFGTLKPCIVYIESNPNPCDFKKPNFGLTKNELNEFYGEDLYEILVKIQAENKMFFMLLFGFLTLVLTIITLLAVIFGVIL